MTLSFYILYDLFLCLYIKPLKRLVHKQDLPICQKRP